MSEHSIGICCCRILLAGLIASVSGGALARAQAPPDGTPSDNADSPIAAESPPGVVTPSRGEPETPADGSGQPAVTPSETPPSVQDTRGLLMKMLEIPDEIPVRLRGWIQNSYTYNANGRGSGLNFGDNPNFKADQWMGNQYYLIFERPLKQSDEVNFGFRVDNLFGNDWQFTYMQGFFNRAFPNGSFAGDDLPQFFGEAHLPVLTPGGLDVKAGRWYGIVGYEVVPAADRTMLSVPYSFNYGQPFTHVGVLTTLHLTDRVDLYNGSVNGWDRWINERYIWGYTGGFTWKSPSEKTKLAFATVCGPNQFPSFLPANQPLYPTGYINIPSVAGLNNPGYHRNDRTLFTFWVSEQWTGRLKQVIGTGAGMERAIPGLGAPLVDGVPQNAHAKYDTWYGFVNLFAYNVTSKLTGIWRSEVFWDTNGARTGKLVGDRYYEITLGLRYQPASWLLIRPEARYDWSQYHPAYDNDTRKSQFTLGFDVLILF
jgi:hypothetical protein